jgi:hypothetical protein
MVDLLISYRAALQYAIIAGLAFYAIARGDPPERIAALALPLMIALIYFYELALPQDGQYEAVDPFLMMIDLVGLIIFAALALKANRMYPLWLLAAQLVSVMMHFARDINADMPGMVYFILTTAPSYVQITALGIGLYCHRRRIARYGKYRPWRTS